jgi:2-amino-4-hydroxy-6-hydroxymethyldihydropteridine diphosphokinase
LVIAAVSIGSNLGDRDSHLAFARERLSELLTNLRFSSAFETDPVGVIGEHSRFLNAAAVGETGLSARALLDELLAIEADRGRERPFARAPRTLDLDLILFGDVILDAPGLVVPHPRFRERRFVLEPLAQIAPDLKDPVTGKTVRDLLELLRINGTDRSG